MKPFEEQFAAWVDGKLSGEELAAFEKQLASRPEALRDRDEALRLRKLLRDHPAAPRLSNPDFFNHQIMQRIAAETPRNAKREKPRALFWWLPRLALAGAFGLAMGFAIMQFTPGAKETPAIERSNYFAQVVEAWPSDPSISATTVYNAQDNVTVVWLDGLDYIPASYALQ